MTTSVEVMPATRPPCPPWCVCDSDSPFSDAEWDRRHHGSDFRMTYPDLIYPDQPLREVVVQLGRFDIATEPGAVEVTIGGVHPDNPLTLDDTEQLAYLLLRTVASARTGRTPDAR
jgi:hypothetical protein